MAYTTYVHNLGKAMSKHKSHGKDKKKSNQLVIRVDKAERDDFVTLCDQLDTSAAREIRRFMHELVAAHSGENPAPSGEPENAVIADTGEDEPVSDAALSQRADAEVEIQGGETEKPKKKPKRVLQQSRSAPYCSSFRMSVLGAKRRQFWFGRARRVW